MMSQVGYARFVSKTKYNYYHRALISNDVKNQLVPRVEDGLNVFWLPNNYFDIYRKWDLFSNNYVTSMSFNQDGYGEGDRVEKFDFSGEDLGDISVLPDFTNWAGGLDGLTLVLYLDFSYCGITDLSPFINNIKKIRDTRIYLEGNVVNKENYEEFKAAAQANKVIIMSEPTIQRGKDN